MWRDLVASYVSSMDIRSLNMQHVVTRKQLLGLAEGSSSPQEAGNIANALTVVSVRTLLSLTMVSDFSALW